jgi:L-2-hydroxyglutarate oxidase LhgO
MSKLHNLDADLIVIGAGVVGLAVSYTFSMKGKDVILIEKEKQFGTGVSSRNTEVIHAGVYYANGSLKNKLCLRGKELIYDFCKKNSVKHKRIGKLFVAIDENDVSKLELIIASAKNNGLKDLIELDSHQLQKAEPFVKGKSAILSPSSGIIDSHGFMQALMNLNISFGTTYAACSLVIGAEPISGGWCVKIGGVDPCTITSRVVVNATGLNALKLSSEIFPKRTIPKANPIKGAYLRYAGKSPIKHIIYPAIVPGIIEERVDATPDLSGSLRFGPSIEKTLGIEDFTTPTDLIERFTPKIKKYLPDIDESKLIIDQAGIRPKILSHGKNNEDFIFDWADDNGWLDLWGIESPGLTSSLAIGDHVYSMVDQLSILK